ncbi:MAG: TonB-dependent receptor plug domain-containing protein [Pseudomonadota bacterium]
MPEIVESELKRPDYFLTPPTYAFHNYSRLGKMVCAISVLTSISFSSVWAANFAAFDDLTILSFEELGDIEITSVSKRSEKLADAPASIYVISNEDIRRSGVTSLAEALRLAPNLQVARVNTGQYAISARGFNNGIGNKLLVLIDGRTVYTPLFSTVNWDSQHVMLEDVERIEVISGPGATLWGANAVNGVINIITRSAHDTQGGLVTAGAGNREQNAAARYGGTFGTDGHYRLYATGSKLENSVRGNGTNVLDGWDNTQAGFRIDKGHAANNFTLQGDTYKGKSEAGPLGSPAISGTNILARWSRHMADNSSYQLQMYYDQTDRDNPFTYRDQAKTFDIGFQHGLPLVAAHRILWGGGYRFAQTDTQTHFNALNPLPQVFIPADPSQHWENLFIQDEIALNTKTNLTLGMKAERNVYTGVEYLPNVRIAWKPSTNQLLWGALSRAVRAPARLDRDFYLYLSLPNRPLIPIIKGGPDFQSEIANVIELGYRSQPNNALSYSITGFYNIYDKLRSGQPPPAVVQNMMEGKTYGFEAWGNYQATPNWRLSAGWMELRQDLKVKPGSLDPTGPRALGNDPDRTWQLRSAWNITNQHQLDVTVRHVAALPMPIVPAYTAIDGHFNWRIHNNVDISLLMQNIFGSRHAEFDTSASRSEFGRSVFLKLVWRM